MFNKTVLPLRQETRDLGRCIL